MLFYFNFIINKKVISVRILLSLDRKQLAMFHRTSDPCARSTGKGDGRGGLVTVTTGRLNIRGADVD